MGCHWYIQLDQGEETRGLGRGEPLPVTPIHYIHDKKFPSKAMFLHLRCPGSMRGRQAISCCSRSRCVFPSHRSPNHLQLSPQLEYSISACEVSWACGAAEQLECAVVMKGVAAWGLSSQPTPEGSLRQDNLKICINIQISGAFFCAHCETQD